MPIDPTDKAFSESFVKSARTKVSAETRRTWDEGLARDPRLLVGLDLQAFVVAQKTRCGRLGLRPGEDPRDGWPQPFEELDREPGIYLHWALPDGLTQGTADDDGSLDFPVVPDRWLVLRVEPGRKRRVRGFVVEGERAESRKLQGWKERPRDPGPRQTALTSDRLTVVASGDVASAAVFDSSENRFGFYDDLQGVPAGARPLMYVVVGWYSQPELDPLHRTADDPPFDELMRRLGWTVDEARLEAARAEVAARVESIADAEPVEVRGLDVAGADTALKIARDQQLGVPATNFAPRAIDDAEVAEVKVEPWSPTQSLYHASLFGVRTDQASAGGNMPDPASIELSFGGTGAESLARLIAEGIDSAEPGQMERLLTAFSYDLLDAWDEVDGVPRLEEELHLRGFVASPGGHVEELVRAGDPVRELEQQRRAGEQERQRKKTGKGGKSGEGGTKAPKTGSLEFLTSRQSDTVDEFTEQVEPEVLDPPPEPERLETVERALPRFFRPQDGVLSIRGLGRSLRHGFDGRFEPDERLACRLSGDPVQEYAGLIRGEGLLESRLDHGSIPAECEQLLHEALLEDPFALDSLAEEAAAQSNEDVRAVKKRMKGERALMLRSQQAGSDAPRLAASSLKSGVTASPIAVTVWKQPFVPMFVDWEVTVATDDDVSPERWGLGELDYRPKANDEPETTESVTGRSLLTASGPLSFGDQVNRFLADEEALDAAGVGGQIDDATEALLRKAATDSALTDVLTAAFEGVREHLLGYRSRAGEVVDLGDDPPPPLPTSPPQLIRGGTLRVTKLRVLDAFGQILDLPTARLQAMLASESVRPPANATWPSGALYMPPRLLPPTRLMLRLVDATDDLREATADQGGAALSPVDGWVMPDNVDAALEFFDASGAAAGQLRHERLSRGVSWESAPGVPGPLGAAPSETLASRQLAAMATALVQRDAAERDQPGFEQTESPLSALLRVIDTTRWTVDPFGQTGTEHLSALVGRPVAVVRASLTLEVQSDADDPRLDPAVAAARVAAFAELSSKPFEVRLGALTRMQDGLLGYFVGDDYRHFHPVHSSVLSDALPAGPHSGFLSAAAAEDRGLEPEPIESTYVVSDPTVSVRPGQTVFLTLLMDPGSAVHATTGILPRKSISLLREWTSAALDRIAPSFRAGPVLLDPAVASMPKASVLPADQLWSYRDTPMSWRDRQIVESTKEAGMPEQPPVAQEGYVRAQQEPR